MISVKVLAWESYRTGEDILFREMDKACCMEEIYEIIECCRALL